MKIRKIKVLSFKKNEAQLSNGELLTAILKDDTDFLIQATTLSGDLLPYVPMLLCLPGAAVCWSVWAQAL